MDQVIHVREAVTFKCFKLHVKYDFFQAFEILKPDCKGVLHEEELAKIPVERYKKVDKFIASVLFEESADEDSHPIEGMDNEPMIPIITAGGPPPEELGWEAEIVNDNEYRKDEL